ncbi:bifunctional alpha/beta hydrolase/OsmC family protein [Microscilla marina]|uniref:Hydrolases of the alpha/beta superfamily n=1 Tax=Microscilla marina ATCC 23134 TaxID=313606 RepID=A1ZRI5_MICM2|nr:bifunctional alpha/beta hydrolase/OsmC family protein [Microscilla marina]EAY27075.1 hydrolases of the alpha/beta superfamily [Microscilla marina ATCC 23134]
MKTFKVNFDNAQGDTLDARLELPADQHPHNYVLFAHCFTCGKNLVAIKNISRSLTRDGFAVLRFDFTGLGESEGEFADTNFSSNIEDLIQAAKFLEQNYQAPTVLVGHSLGGAAVLAAKQNITSVKAIATIGAPYHPAHVTHLFQNSQEEIEATGAAEVSIGGRPFKIKKQFLDDVTELSTNHQLIHHLNAALMVIHAPEDKTVELDNATQIYKAAQHPRNFVALDGADHLMSRKEDSLYVGDVIATWAKRYVDMPTQTRLSSDAQTVARTGEEGYTTDIITGNHRLTADEPASVGGNDFGPTPYDLLNAALGACTGMTLRMYADRKKWDLQGVKVHIEHNKVHAQECADCETEKGKVDEFVRTIELEGNLDDDQRKRLMEIADKCPVHRTLHNEVKVRTSLKG